MFNIARGGPSSVARLLFSPSAFSRINPPTRTRDVPRFFSRISPTVLQAFRSGAAQWRRRREALRRGDATSAVAEGEAIEGVIDQDVSSQTPPSDRGINREINRAVQHAKIIKFKELAEHGMVCPTVVDTITNEMGLETMTEVQSLTISESLKGRDILAQARTGTGKTLAFLIPVLQNIINVDPTLEKRSGLGRRGNSEDIRAIIISPTRELAEQIAVEAKRVTRNTGVIVQTAVGGSAKMAGLRQLKQQGCHILVATPGRLTDILSDPYSHVKAPNLSCFVLDEADRLLDDGFAPDIQRIQDHLPDRRDVDRQTLLYSATVPQEVMHVVRQTMKPDFQFIRTVKEGEQQTHEKVIQKLVTVPGFENIIPVLLELCKREINATARNTTESVRPFKAIVYFSATAHVSLTAAVLQSLRNPGQSVFHEGPLHPAKVIEIHGKLDQGPRTKAAEAFRNATSAVLLSSDVTARGMDFPNVTHVIQVGLPPSPEQYIHRIGRTARGGKTGEGWLLLSKLEAGRIRRQLPGMPLQPDNTLETVNVDMKKDAQLPEHVAATLIQVGEAMKYVPRTLKNASYSAMLSYYNWYPDKRSLVEAVNDLAAYGWGMAQSPAISPQTARRINIAGIPGVNIGYEERTTNRVDNLRDRGMRSFGQGRGDSGYDRNGGEGRPRYRDRGDYGGGRGGYGGDRGGYGGDRGNYTEQNGRQDRGPSRY